MGRSSSGFIVFGLHYNGGPEDPGVFGEGWPDVSLDVFEAAEAMDFDDWLEAHLGMNIVDDSVIPLRVRDYEEYQRELKKRCREKFGIPGFATVRVGQTDYDCTTIVYPDMGEDEDESIIQVHDDAEVIDPNTILRTYSDRWTTALRLLAEVLPGSSGVPGLYLGSKWG